jgi:acetolactate synthase small subunit
MAEIKQAGKQKPTFFSRLPKLGRISQLVIFIGVFLIILIPLIIIYNQQKLDQAGYEQEILLLKRILSTPYTQAATLEDEIRKAEASLNIVKNKYPTVYLAKESLNDLFKIADANDVDITRATTSISENTITDDASINITYPSMLCNLEIEGDSARFQNFLSDIKKLETCRINAVIVNMATDENEEDKAILNLNILLQR